MTLSKLWNWIFGPRCRSCGTRGATRLRMNTQYVQEELNYTVECNICFERTQDHWNDMWQEHWRNVR